MNDELTREDIRKMKEELDYRRLELMPGLIEEVKRTRAFGDLSELRPMCEAQMLLAKPNEVGLRGKGRIISPVDAVPLAAQHDLAMLF